MHISDQTRRTTRAPRIAIFRTDPVHLAAVVRHSKHALERRPQLRTGDIILLSQLGNTLVAGAKPIQFAMSFVRCYPDAMGESLKIWGKRWRYIVEGSRCYRLREAFDIRDVSVTNKEYGAGGPIVYVDPRDAAEILRRGLLAPAPSDPTNGVIAMRA